MDKILDGRLRQVIRTYLERGRPGDYEHTLRTISYARRLLQHEEGEEEIVIPALHLHDIGWSQVDYKDFITAPSLHQRYDSVSLDLHMKYGAALAETILEKLGHKTERTRCIVSIIAVHDIPEKIYAMENPSATMVLEADWLDRYGPESVRRFKAMFGKTALTEKFKKDMISHFRDGLKQWFKTRTARSMAMNLARESGLFG